MGRKDSHLVKSLEIRRVSILLRHGAEFGHRIWRQLELEPSNCLSYGLCELL